MKLTRLNVIATALAAAALTACATTPEASAARVVRLEAANQMAREAATQAVQDYCALPPLARAVVRAKVTNGIPVIVCPGDLIPMGQGVGPAPAP